MANLLRIAKSGSNWAHNELLAYNIVIEEQSETPFLNGSHPQYSGPVGFIEDEDRVQGLDTSSLALIKRLDLANKAYEGEESAVGDFAAELLRAMGYETDQTVVRIRKDLGLFICGEIMFSKPLAPRPGA